MRRGIVSMMLAALGALVALGGYSPTQQSRGAIGGAVRPANEALPVAQAPPPVTGAPQEGAQPSSVTAEFPPMSAETFAKQVAANEKAAFDKYRDKRLTIEGVVAEKRNDKDGSSLILTGYRGPKEALNVQALLALIDDYTAEQFEKIKVGDKVKVNRVYSTPSVERPRGKASYTQLSECKVIK